MFYLKPFPSVCASFLSLELHYNFKLFICWYSLLIPIVICCPSSRYKFFESIRKCHITSLALCGLKTINLVFSRFFLSFLAWMFSLLFIPDTRIPVEHEHTQLLAYKDIHLYSHSKETPARIYTVYIYL